ncbi:MAG: hypothetical protein KIS66_17460 [Fimbriimonadaceae bacterium]|nr:hypothetical protein [Fimbriimonadaceae bacterium]
MRTPLGLLAIATLGAALAGCDVGPVNDDPVAVTPLGNELTEFKPDVQVGLPVEPDPTLAVALAEQIQSGRTQYRPNPFALLPAERKYESDQGAARLISSIGFYTFLPPEVKEEAQPMTEPQPYRRLSGILVGQSVTGILEDDSRPGEGLLIRPGMAIPNSPWRVASIDSEKAVLRRTGPNAENTFPREVTVRLESRPGGTGFTPGGVPGRAPGGAAGGGRGGGVGQSDDF